MPKTANDEISTPDVRVGCLFADSDLYFIQKGNSNAIELGRWLGEPAALISGRIERNLIDGKSD
jgi:hypothetical protein